MATARKSSARTSKAGKKITRSAKPKKAPAASRPEKKLSRPGKPAAVKRGKEVKAAKAPPPKGKEVVVKGKAVPQAAGKVAGAKAAARKKGVAAPAEVRPLGVLPPGSMVRSNPRPAVASVPASASGSRVAVPPPSGGGAQRVTEADLKEFEQRLLAERQKILKEMGHLENTVLKINQRDSAGDLSGYSFHMADVGTDAMEREKAFLFASAEGRTLLEINEALRRLYRGEYGVCESCGQPIARARLEAMPNARLCLSCKTKEERASRGAV
jgi:RNA polymerase-binding protein DksA